MSLMDYDVMIFDGSYGVGVMRNRKNGRLAVTFDYLYEKHYIGCVTEHSKSRPAIAMEFVSDKSIDIVIGQLLFVKNYKYHMFETLTEYNGFLTVC